MRGYRFVEALGTRPPQPDDSDLSGDFHVPYVSFAQETCGLRVPAVKSSIIGAEPPADHKARQAAWRSRVAMVQAEVLRGVSAFLSARGLPTSHQRKQRNLYVDRDRNCLKRGTSASNRTPPRLSTTKVNPLARRGIQLITSRFEVKFGTDRQSGRRLRSSRVGWLEEARESL